MCGWGDTAKECEKRRKYKAKIRVTASRPAIQQAVRRERGSTLSRIVTSVRVAFSASKASRLARSCCCSASSDCSRAAFSSTSALSSCSARAASPLTSTDGCARSTRSPDSCWWMACRSPLTVFLSLPWWPSWRFSPCSSRSTTAKRTCFSSDTESLSTSLPSCSIPAPGTDTGVGSGLVAEAGSGVVAPW